MSVPKVTNTMDLYYLGQFDRIYAYARVSSKDQADKRKSLDGQLDRLRNIKPTPNILFCDVQGGDERERPDYQQLRQQVRSDFANGLSVLVVVTELDRLSRDNEEINSFIEELDMIGARLYALDGGFYGAKEPHEWLRTNQEGIFAEYYLRKLRMRLRQTKTQRRDEGKPLFTKPPFGYLWTREKPIPDPDNWTIARALIDLFIGDPKCGTRQLQRFAEQNGIQFSRNGLRKWLLNPVLRGHLAFTKGGDSREARKKRRKEREELIARGETPPKIIKLIEIHYNTHEPLITEEEFQIIQYKLEENRKYYGRNYSLPRYPLSGLIFCGECDSKMTRCYGGRKGSGYVPAYRCVNTKCPRRRTIVESRIDEAVKEALMTEQYTKKMATLSNVPSDVVKSPQEIEKEKQLSELEDTYKKTRLDALLPLIRQLRIELADIRHKADEQQEQELNPAWEAFKHLMQNDDWDDVLELHEKRKLYHDLVERIVIYDHFNISVQVKI